MKQGVSLLYKEDPPVSSPTIETKRRIFDAARELFALHGFGAVSMRDIANKVGIKTSSIYYHYGKKEDLIQDILSSFQNEYIHAFEQVSSIAVNANSLEEFMDSMFSKEVMEMLDPHACLSMSLAFREQHHNAHARNCVFDLFYTNSIMLLQSHFRMMINKKLASPVADTRTLATLFMFCLIAAADLRVHEYMGITPPINYSEVYTGLKKIITSALAPDPS
jgi:AcrR family transcriptional regulator